MADAGWYPDPEGRPGHVRYWDGQAWVGESTPSDEGARTSNAPGAPGRGRTVLLIALAVVLVVAFGWGVWESLRDAVTEDPVASARPTGSVWNEEPPTVAPSTPVPTDPTPSGGAAVDCPVVNNVVEDHPRDGRVHGGGMSFGVPEGWAEGGSWSMVLTDESGASRLFDSGWASFLAVGRAPSAAGFVDPALTAVQVLECHVTSGRFSGYTGHTIDTSQEITIDGQPGWWVRGQATSTRIPGGGATYDVVVVDTGSPDGDAVYWAGAVDADATALADLDSVRADLRLND
ncbi:DUF2510 domain-containing protein [Tessaracoccus antarcticus]|uniref:DUF2510 domain-containing protein n=1 Tax=Tessaracoccus antarcticus TaxID=2479848 RepID=A0A3M0GJX9_9ACTN|nr:DUF2510 domain-containing protein [Tessaracoccus antarcticus]RMB61933.1 DUF2510 domain-containing protein [Tessaracoccus antarcticus]